MDLGTVIGLIIGIIAAIVLIAVVIWCCCCCGGDDGNTDRDVESGGRYYYGNARTDGSTVRQGNAKDGSTVRQGNAYGPVFSQPKYLEVSKDEPPAKPNYTHRPDTNRPKYLGINKVKPEHMEVFLDNNGKLSERNKVDLHLLHKTEATLVVTQAIIDARKEGLSYIYAITGKGIHSENQQPVIKPAVEQLLKSKNMEYEIPNDNQGMIKIYIRR